MKKNTFWLHILLIMILASCSSTHAKTSINIPKNNIDNKLSLSKSGRLNSVKMSYVYTESGLSNIFNSDICRGLNKYYCNQNLSNLQTNPIFAATDGDFSESNSSVINAYKINYTGVGVFGEKRNLSGSILMPQIDPAKIKGVLLFFPPTIVGSENALSYTFKDGLNVILAKIFANQGYIVLSPDYIGMGDDNKVPHPYVIYPRENSNAGLSMLVAFRNFATTNQLDDLAKPLDLYVTGFSEGGAYTLWFNKYAGIDEQYRKILDSNGYMLKQTVAIDGAYDVSNLTYSYLLDNVQIESNKYNVLDSKMSTLVKPALLSNVLVPYVYYSNYQSHVDESVIDYNNIYEQYFNPDFLYMNCKWYFGSSCKFGGATTNLVDFAMSANGSYKDENYSFLKSQAKFFITFYKSAYKQSESGINYNFDDNSAKALVSKKLLTNKNFINKMKQSNIYKYTALSPVTLISLAHDSVVTELNFREACDNIKMSDSSPIPCITLDNDVIKVKGIIGYDSIDHPSALGYLLFIARSQFSKSQKD